MSDVTTPPLEVQAFYSTATGMILREDGRSRPATLDEIEQRYSQAALDDVMSMPGHWHELIPATRPAVRCRCWSHGRGEWVAIVLPGIGKVEVSIGRTINSPPVLAVFNKVLEADMLARRNVWKRDGSDKAYVELSEDEMNLVASAAVRPITRAVRHVNLAAFNPPTKPAA